MKGTSHVRRRYVGIRSSYSSIRSSYSSYAEVLRFLCVHLKIRSTYVAGPIRRTYVTHTCYIRKQRGRYVVDTYFILLIRHTYVAVKMPRNRDVCTAYLSYLLRMCDVCVAYPRMSFRIYGVSATYVWRISRINGVSATCTYVLRSFRYCGVCMTY